MDHCSFYDGGAQYPVSGNVVALVVRDIYSTFGVVHPAASKSAGDTALAQTSYIGDAKVMRFILTAPTNWCRLRAS